VLDYLGAPLDEVIGWGWMDKVHPDDVAFKVRTWLQNLESKKPHHPVCRFRGADSRYRWFEVRGEPLRAADGRVLSWYGVLIDIDDQRKAEEALRESEYKKAEEQPRSAAQLQATLNVIPAYTWYAAPSGGITFVNKRTADYLGLPQDHPLRFGIDVGAQYDAHIPFLHPDDQEGARKTWPENMRTGEASEYSFRVRNAQGGYRWFLSRVEPLRASDGTLLQWVGVNLDIEELKRVEQALRESESKLRQVIDTVPGLLWSIGPDGELTQINQGVLDYSGMRFEDHLGYYKFHHPDDLSDALNAFSHAMQTGTSYQALSRLRRADGEYRWHQVRAQPLRDREGRIVQWYGLSVDIEERKQAEDRLRRSEAYLAEAQRLSQTGSFGWTPSTGELHWSDETFRILEYDPSIKPTIERVLQRIHPDDRAMIRQLIHETSSGEKDFDVAHRLLMPDGSVKFVHVLSHALKDAAGNLEIVGALMDVTENTRLYRDLAEREAKVRRLIDSNIIGIFIWQAEGRILEANDAFLHIVGYDHKDVVSGKLRWTDLTPAEWRERDERGLAERKSTGKLQPYEKEYFRKDGSRVPALMGAANFEESGSQGVAFVLDLTERKRAEQALRESEYKLRQIIETVPGLLWSNGPDGEPTHVSQRMLDYSGMRFEDFKHRGWEAFVHPDDFPETAKAFYHAIQTGTSYEGVIRLRRADGEYRWHHARAKPLRDGQGRVIQWYGLSVDIDERKKAEDRLRRSEAHLAEAQRLSHTGSSVYSETAILYWSDETYRIWGFDPRDGLPSRQAMLQRIHPDDRDRHHQETNDALREKRDCSIEFRIVLADGTVKDVEKIYHPVFSTSGELVEIVASGIDVTERKRTEDERKKAEERLRLSEARLAEAQRLSQTGSWAWSPDQDIRYWSDECYRVLSFDPRDGLPRFEEFFQRIHPDDQPGFREVIQTAIREKAEWEADYRIVHLDGPVRDIYVVGHPVLSTSGHLVEFVGTVIDVTERRRAEQERARLHRLEADLAHINRVSTLGEMSASLAHEITQPIAAARNNARAALNYLDQQPPDLGEVGEALGCVVGDADRAGLIVDRIRDHIKKAPPRKHRFDLNEAIREVILLARSAIAENGVSVQTHLTDGLAPVEGDRVQLQQVILNLALNAAEAMSTVDQGARELLISSEQSQTNGVRVTVRDTGPGIDPEHIERVFEAFYTTKSSGVGMGLSICRSIIEAHGGRLWADANEPRGAVFQFTLHAQSSS
jgi:PAS domain S-box-containing protein